MTYDTETAAISRQPCQLVVLTLDACSLTYGEGDCTATADEKCFNTFFTSRDQANYAKTTKEYKFTSYHAPLPFPGVYPYLQSVNLLPTEIGKKITVKGRVKINLLDELSNDVGIDPYYATRSSIQGEFFKKLIARNPNYKGRSVKVYDGYIGLAEEDFEQRWQGEIDKITITKGRVTIDCVDSLVDLGKVSYPGKIETELNINITETSTALVLTSLIKEDGETVIDSAGYVRINDEIIHYSSLTESSNQLNVDERGAFGTTATAHESGDRTTLVKYFEVKNPFVHLKEIWDDAGGDWSTDFDLDEWTKWQTFPTEDVDFSAVITEDEELTCEDAFWEIADVLDLMIWQGGDQRITVRRNIANDPDRVYTNITDSANIIDQSGGVDFNDKERKTRLYHYWNKQPLGEFGETSSYDKINIGVLANEEAPQGYDGVEKDEIFNRWVSLRFLPAADAIPFITASSNRRLMNRARARALIMVSVELKDEGLETGGLVILSTDERLDIYGNPILINHIVIRRDTRGGRVTLTLKEIPGKRLGLFAPDSHPIYADSTIEEREYGYFCGTDNLMPNGDGAYHFW